MRRIIILISMIVSVAFAGFCDEFADIINAMKYSPKLEQYAKDGNVIAQNTLGLVYKRGSGVEKDLEKAVYWFRQSADRGHDNAMVNLGGAYLNGEGVDKDPAKAASLFEQAAQQGNQAGMFDLATLYLKGLGVPRDPAKAFSYAEQAANSVIKTRTLADSEASTLEQMRVTAKAQAFLAFLFRMGIGTAKDMDKSFEYLKRAAKNGELNACMILGDAYEYGKGQPKDLGIAESYYRKAADQGMPLAQYALGVKYSTGETIAKNTPEAISYLTKVIDTKEKVDPMVKADAMLKLADILEASGSQADAAKAKNYRAQASKLPKPDPAKIKEMLSAD